MTISEAIREAHRRRAAAITEGLVAGVKTYEEYRFQIGCLRGMYDLMQDIDAMLNRIEDEDRDDFTGR